MRFLDHDVTAAAKAHAMSEWPKESCGVVTQDGYIPLINVHPDPEEAFDCIDQFSQYQIAGTAIALIHSHPGGPDHPSKEDMEQQLAMDIPWGIVTAWGNDNAKDPWFWGPGCHQDVFNEDGSLKIRAFRHGPSGTDGRGDCYATIMDYYRQARGIDLRECPRDWKWWKNKQSLYEDNFTEFGWHQVHKDEAQPGDLILCALQSNGILNHAGVYLGDGLVLHHCDHRLMCRETVGSLGVTPTLWLRYGSDEPDLPARAS